VISSTSLSVSEINENPPFGQKITASTRNNMNNVVTYADLKMNLGPEDPQGAGNHGNMDSLEDSSHPTLVQDVNVNSASATNIIKNLEVLNIKANVDSSVEVSTNYSSSASTSASNNSTAELNSAFQGSFKLKELSKKAKRIERKTHSLGNLDPSKNMNYMVEAKKSRRLKTLLK